jgi:hypothetical protein
MAAERIENSSWASSSFTTGSGSYNLESVTLLFQENTADLNNLFVRLYGNNSGVPGTLITTFTNPASIPDILGNNTFTLTTPQALTASTTYWLVSGVSSGTGDYLGVIHFLTLKQDCLAGLLVKILLLVPIKGEVGGILRVIFSNLALMGQNSPSPSRFLNPVPLLLY